MFESIKHHTNVALDSDSESNQVFCSSTIFLTREGWSLGKNDDSNTIWLRNIYSFVAFGSSYPIDNTSVLVISVVAMKHLLINKIRWKIKHFHEQNYWCIKLNFDGIKREIIDSYTWLKPHRKTRWSSIKIASKCQCEYVLSINIWFSEVDNEKC